MGSRSSATANNVSHSTISRSTAQPSSPYQACPPCYAQATSLSSRTRNGCSFVVRSSKLGGSYVSYDHQSHHPTDSRCCRREPAGTGLKDYNLGTLGNTIAGAIGGAGGGQILTALVPMLAGTAGNVDISSVIGQVVGGGVSGAILTIVVALIKNAMAGQPAK